MPNDAKRVLTPKLRFPEFRGKPLPQVQLGDVTEDCTNRKGDSETSAPVMGVRKIEGIVPMEERLIGKEIGRYKRLEPDWFAYNPMRINIGSIARWKGQGGVLVSPDYVVFRCLTDSASGIIPEYLDHFRSSDQWEDFVTRSGDGGVRIRIYYKDLARLSLRLPSLAEQQKIADCLTSLDELIVTQDQKVEALKSRKTGLTQQLFPREHETLPRLRFPEFDAAPEWEERELGPSTLKVGSGITPLGGDKNYKTKGRRFIRSQNVGWGQLILDDVVYIDEDLHASFNATEIAEHDVLLNITGASIGRSAVADSRIIGGNVNQHVCIIRVNREELNPVLLNHFLISDRGQKQIDSFQAGGNRQGLNFAQIRSFRITVPPTLAEQQRIAECLGSLDARLIAEAEKLAALKIHKKGLMQQLFLSPETD
jgi:type I restriction enzyme S subunit